MLLHKFFTFCTFFARRFAATTTIHGFEQIDYSSHWLESLFWVAVVCAGIFLSVRDCAMPVASYMEEEMITSMGFVDAAKFEFPGAKLCFPLYTDRLEPNDTALDVQHVEDFVLCLCSFECREHVDFYAIFGNELLATFQLIAHYYASENGKADRVFKTTVTPRLADFYAALLRTNVTSRELIEGVGLVLCKRIKYNNVVLRRKQIILTDFCANTSVTWLGVPPFTESAKETLCFNASHTTVFNSTYEVHELSFSPERIYPRLADARDLKGTHIYFDVNDDPASTDISTDVARGVVGSITVAVITLEAQIDMLSKRRWPCSTIESKFKCKGRFRVRGLEEICNCTTVTWELPYPDLVDESKYKSCFRAHPPAAFETCGYAAKKSEFGGGVAAREECIGACSFNIYRIETTTLVADETSNLTVLKLSLHRMFYPRFDERFAVGIADLVSSFGGIIGLWLGASIIGVIHLLLFPLKVAYDYTRRRRVHTFRLAEEHSNIKIQLRCEHCGSDSSFVLGRDCESKTKDCEDAQHPKLLKLKHLPKAL